MQELLGHADVSTTMIYTHVLNKGPLGVVSPRSRCNNSEFPICFYSFLYPPQPGKQLVDIPVTIIGHEQHVHLLQLFLGATPFQLRVSRPGKDETVEDHGWVFQPLLDILNPFVEQNLLAGGAFVQKAVRFDEGDELFSVCRHPQNKIGMEIPRLEESHTFAPAHVPEQEEFHPILFQSCLMAVAPGFQIGDKLIFALAQGNRQDDPGEFFILPMLCSVVPLLQQVDVHQQRFAAAGGVLHAELVQGILVVRRHIGVIVPVAVKTLNECIEIGKHPFTIAKKAVQITVWLTGGAERRPVEPVLARWL
ncbi:MAG: hypothetical protein WBM02_05945 [bacterium]